MPADFGSLIWKLFYGLKHIADKSKLSRFWLNLMKKYGRSMLSEDQVKWIVNAKLKGKLTGKLQACKAYQPEGYSSFTANTKVQGLFIFRKRLEGINSLCLSKLNMKSLSFTKCTEPSELYRQNSQSERIQH
jgi:hypothetical protein